MRQGLIAVLLGVLILLSQGLALAGTPGISDLSDNTVAYGSASLIDPDIQFTGGGEYRDGFLRFSLSAGTDVDRISFYNDPDPDALGALTVTDGLLYLGNGWGRDVIGSVDETENGEEGAFYTLRFHQCIEKRGSHHENTLGWTGYESPYPNNLDGEPIDYAFNHGKVAGTGTIHLPGVVPSWYSFFNRDYGVYIDRHHHDKGHHRLHLKNLGRLSGDQTDLQGPDGNGSMHGPYVVSDPFDAEKGDGISFDWSAEGNRDAYEVFGFLINEADGSRTGIFSQRGDETYHNRETAAIPDDGTYRMEFVCGSYDRTGKLRVGASLFINHIRIISHKIINDDLVSDIARHVTYENTNDSGAGETRTVTVNVEASDGNTTSASATITVTTVEGPVPFMTVNTGLTVVKGGTAVVDTRVLNAADPDTPDECLVFEGTSQPAHGRLDYADQPGVAIESFTQEDLEKGRVRYVHDGSDATTDTLVFLVTDGENALEGQTLAMTISIDNAPPVIAVNKGIIVSVNGSAVIETSHLSASDPDSDDASLVFTLVSGPSQGRIEDSQAPGKALCFFKQADLIDGRIIYVHTGLETGSDSFGFAVDDGTNVLINQTFDITITSAQLSRLTTTNASDIGSTGLATGGIISHDGGAPITARGVCWDTAADPDITGNHTEDGEGAGTFTSEITGLEPDTTYYFRAYATNEAGTAYGNGLTVKTLSDAVVSVATDATDVSESGFTANWAEASGADAYRIDISPAGDFTVFIEGYEDRRVTGLSETLDGLVPGKTYYYRVRVETEGEAGPSSNVIAVTLDGHAWIGGNGNWNDPGNWSRGLVPGAGDEVFIGTNMDLGNITITMTEPADVGGLTLDEDFAGILDCGTGPVTIFGDVILSGGTFIAPSGTLTITGDVNADGGAFVHNGGAVVLDGTGQEISGVLTFYDLVKHTEEPDTLTLTVGAHVTVANELDLAYVGLEDAPLLVVAPSDFGAFPICEPMGDVTLDKVVITEFVTLIPALSLLPSGGPAVLYEGDSLSIKAEFNVAASQDITVALEFSGTALSGVDYQASSESVILPAGSLAGSLTLSAVEDDLTDEPEKTITVTAVKTGAYTIRGDLTLTVIIGAEGLPRLTTGTVAAGTITPVSFDISGTLASQGGSQVTETGFCWSTEPAPTTGDGHVITDIKEILQATIGGLVPGMTYYVRAYAENDTGVGYGEDVVVQTPGASLIKSPWNDRESWSTGDVPGPEDDVYVGLNTDLGELIVQINADVDVASLTLADTFEGALVLGIGQSLTTGFYLQDGGTVDVSNGTVDINGSFILNGGLFIAPGTLFVEGDFIHSGGTFSANNGTVVLDGNDQIISGDTVFNNLTKQSAQADTLTFGNGTDLNITGTLTLHGASDDAPLSLACSDTPTSVIIEQDSNINHLEADECVQLIFKAGAEGDDGDLPVATLSHTPPPVTRALTYAITVGGFGVTHYRYNLDNEGWIGVFSVNEPIVTLVGEGIHTLSVVGRDSNESWQAIDAATTISWRVDRTAPVARVSGCPEGTVGLTDLVITVSGELEPISLYRYSVDSGDWSDSTPASDAIVLAGLGQGDHTLAVIAADRVGNWQSTDAATENTWTFAVDALAVTLSGVPGDPTPEDHATITVSGDNVAAYRYSVDGGAWQQAAVTVDIVLNDLADGRHTLRVSGLPTTDPVAGEPDGSQSASWTVDTEASLAPELQGVLGHPPTTAVDLTWTWASNADQETLSHYRVFVANRTITNANLAQATERVCDLVPEPQGVTEYFTITGLLPATVYHFVVQTVDLAGNVSGISNDVAVVTETTVPTVTSVTFSGGGTSADNGQDRGLTVTGSNFMIIPGGNIIRFENGSVVFEIVNTSGTDTELLATLPAGAPAGTYAIRVINGNGASSTLDDALTIIRSVAAIPVVTGVSPSMVSPGDTLTLTITGQNFLNPVAAVRFVLDGDTGFAAGDVTRVSDTTLTVNLTVPAGAVEGYYTIVVENAGGLANGISVVNLRVVAAEDLDTAGGPVTSTGIVNVTDGEVPVDLTLTTDDTEGGDDQSGYPISVTVTIPAGSTIEENNDGTWTPYTGPIDAPAQIPLSDEVASELGPNAQEWTMGADNPLRLESGDPIIVTVEVAVPAGTPVPSVYVVNDDGSISLAGVSGTADGVDYVPGGTVLNVQENAPEEGMVTYTIGVLLEEMDDVYAVGASVTLANKDYGPCLIGATARHGSSADTVMLIGLLLAALAWAGARRGTSARILVACMVLVMANSLTATASDARKPWYILAGGGCQLINEENNAIFFDEDQSLTVDNDFYPLIRAGYNITGRWAVEAGFRYDIMSGAMETTQPQGEDSVKGYTLLLGPVYRLKPRKLPFIGTIQPFFKGDIGYKKLNNGLAYTIEDYDAALGLEAAVGVEKGPFDFRLGYAYYSLDRNDGPTGFSPAGSSSDLNLSGVFAELTYRFSFGKAKASSALSPDDTDGDGVANDRDKCPDTLLGVKVDEAGCPFDDDKDGVINEKDKCPDTPEGLGVNLEGCPVDSDGDGVYDDNDACPDTPKDIMMVDDKGCPVVTNMEAHDSDGDGVDDNADTCPETPPNTKVDANGCPEDKGDKEQDEDHDGVTDSLDQCPGTPSGAKVDDRGCWPLEGVTFDTGSAKIKPDIYESLQSVIDVLRSNPDVRMEIQGHTDDRGNADYNRMLSDKRANAIRDFLIKYHIASERLAAKGYGEDQPVAPNDTEDGRSINRRVELMPLSD